MHISYCGCSILYNAYICLSKINQRRQFHKKDIQRIKQQNQTTKEKAFSLNTYTNWIRMNKANFTGSIENNSLRLDKVIIYQNTLPIYSLEVISIRIFNFLPCFTFSIICLSIILTIIRLIYCFTFHSQIVGVILCFEKNLDFILLWPPPKKLPKSEYPPALIINTPSPQTIFNHHP